MTGTGVFSIAFAAFILWTLPVVAEDGVPPAAPPQHAEIRVLDIVILSTNRFMVGTNAMSLTAATNFMAARRDSVGLVAVHESKDSPIDVNSATLTRLARTGIPLVMVEKDGEYEWRDRSAADGTRTVKLGTDQFAALRSLKENGKLTSSTGPVLQATADLDTATGKYELNRVELGLFGKSVWLMHKQHESDEDPGTTGILFRKEW